MKRFSPICLVILTACSGVAHREAAYVEGKTQSMVFDFQTGFKRTPVGFYVEDRLVFEEVLTTDDRVGRARKSPWTGAGARQIKAEVMMDRTARTSYAIDPERGRYVGFSRDLDSGQLQMEQSREPFDYD